MRGYDGRFGLVDRRSLLKGSLAAGALGLGMNRLAFAADAAVSTQLPWIKNVQFAGWWYADKAGLFAKAGIAPEFFSGGGNIVVEQIVAGGAANVGIGGFLEGIVEAVTLGSDFVVFATQYQETPACLVSLPKNPIRTPQDIVGKRIGVQGTAREFETIMKLAGLPADSFTPVPVGYDPAPLVEGDVDGYFAFVGNQTVTLQRQGVEIVIATLGQLGFLQYGDVLFAQRSFVDQNRDALVRWLRASIAGWELNNRDLKQGTAYALEVGADQGLDPEQQLAQNTAQVPLMQSALTSEKGLFWISKEQIAGPMYKVFELAGRTNLPDVEKFVDTSLIEEAYGGKTSLAE